MEQRNTIHPIPSSLSMSRATSFRKLYSNVLFLPTFMFPLSKQSQPVSCPTPSHSMIPIQFSVSCRPLVVANVTRRYLAYMIAAHTFLENCLIRHLFGLIEDNSFGFFPRNARGATKAECRDSDFSATGSHIGAKHSHRREVFNIFRDTVPTEEDSSEFVTSGHLSQIQE